MSTAAYQEIGNFLNSISEKHNFRVAGTAPTGKPASDKSNAREYRLQLINSGNDTSETLKKNLPGLLSKNPNVKKVVFNELSPNSSKYSSVSFNYGNFRVDAVIAKGSNKGESFEKKVVNDLKSAFSRSGISTEYDDLLKQLSQANKSFAINEIKKVSQRTGNTKKEGVPIEKLGEVIGDIVLEDSVGKKWYISLKDVNGDTFSSYSGAATLFSGDGTLNSKSDGATFLNAFGVDLNKVQEGYDSRKYQPNKMPVRKRIPVARRDPEKIKKIFEHAWGMNYFYVRKYGSSYWKVFWLDRRALDKLTSNLIVSEVRYPSKTSKQTTIYCYNGNAEYVIEIRNSKGGEYPNDTKFKVKTLLITK